ncbi:MAG: molybdenum cofactor guanylyltransferase [Robiginitomaculum sp.]|nr:molybdenum cofactor guanylyltransferase [Robiginitomaculum sp.]
MADLIGLVLAGGQSSRMGRDKAELILDNERLVDRATALLKNVGCGEVLLSGVGGLADRYPKGGPLSGIDAAACTLPDSSKLLIIPVDMPNLTACLLQVLVQQAHSKTGSHFCSQPLPCYLIISPELRKYLLDVLTKTDSDRSLFRMFQKLGFSQIEQPENSKTLFDNCNTPEQFTAMGGSL